jgi:predicted methyltransferase
VIDVGTLKEHLVVDIEEFLLSFLNHLGQHVGVLAVEFICLDKFGRPSGGPEMRTCSGFFVV